MIKTNIDLKLIRTSIISDEATSHFKKNIFQLYELSKSPAPIEWIFSPSGQGKEPCDGVGDLVNHHDAKHELSKPVIQVIQSAIGFALTVTQFNSAIRLIFLRKDDVEDFPARKLEDWKSGQVKGIQKFRVWGYVGNNLSISRTAGSIFMKNVSFGNREDIAAGQLHNLQSLQTGICVACVCEGELWVAEITQVSNELQEDTVNFMLPHGSSSGYSFCDNKQQT
ncbi:hypothetical protein PR048_024817 [Dryococelus australis]|uniref:Uncharacterized protein n=1 Tax=Dryococelus australis TaxID=614101 RepID=A0ABQ9GPL2_9NEOP|nr:hypothetical protein PR048_024817 [Dryococelus australis]